MDGTGASLKGKSVHGAREPIPNDRQRGLNRAGIEISQHRPTNSVSRTVVVQHSLKSAAASAPAPPQQQQQPGVAMRVRSITVFAALWAASGLAQAAEINGAALSAWWGLPFAGMLLSIASMPLLVPHFWHQHFGCLASENV
jgi:hypothetical protein